MNEEELWEKEKSSKWHKKFAFLFSEDDVFWNNEIKANIFVNSCLVILAGVLILSLILTELNIFSVPLWQMMNVVMLNVPILLVAIFLCWGFKGSRHWIKYVLCIASLSCVVAVSAILNNFAPLIMCIPVALSCRYYSRFFTINVSVLTVIGMAVANVLYALNGMLDANFVRIPDGTVLQITSTGLRGAIQENGYDLSDYMLNLFEASFLPQLMVFAVLAFICVELSRRAHEMVLEQSEISQKTESLKTELDMATKIQMAALPQEIPPFAEELNIDLAAKMMPAKEVGGDFFDYYLIDEDHLMLIVADVSGKGVPAAMFSMIGKTLFRTYSRYCKNPVDLISKVNEQYCEANHEEMFVTAWVGILEFSTGKITAVDAGHEYPIIRHPGGDFELMKDTKSFVLAGMEGVTFKEFTFDFGKGDTLFLYTDGVPEANNTKEEMYGMDRLIKTINRYKSDTADELINDIKADIDLFAEGAAQFDDITMMVLKM